MFTSCRFNPCVVLESRYQIWGVEWSHIGMSVVRSTPLWEGKRHLPFGTCPKLPRTNRLNPELFSVKTALFVGLFDPGCLLGSFWPTLADSCSSSVDLCWLVSRVYLTCWLSGWLTGWLTLSLLGSFWPILAYRWILVNPAAGPDDLAPGRLTGGLTKDKQWLTH